MELAEVLASLPNDSPFRHAFEIAMDPNACLNLTGYLNRSGLFSPNPIEETHALSVLRAILELEFPKSTDPSATWLLFALIGSTHPSLIEVVRKRFAEVDPILRGDLVVLLASAGTFRSAQVLVELVTKFGWPSELSQRFELGARFDAELSRNLDHAEVLFPALLESGHPAPRSIVGLALRALHSGRLDSARLANTSLMRELPQRLQGEYTSREDFAVDLDLAGFADDDKTAARLNHASMSAEHYPASFAIASLVRRGLPVDPLAWFFIGDPIVLDLLYGLLKELGKTSLIPAEYRTHENFARADMLQWLSHPGELSEFPDAIELMKVFSEEDEGQRFLLYVWRFQVKEGDEWMAAISGWYPADAPEGPLRGSHTFSDFASWESATPIEHAERMMNAIEAHSTDELLKLERRSMT